MAEPGQQHQELTILAVADQVSPVLYDHFDKNRWSKVDLVLSCGDLPPYYLDFLASSLNIPVLHVRGNHDGKYPSEDYHGFENMHGRVVSCKGLRVAGFEGSHRYNAEGPQYTEREMSRIAFRSRLKAVRGGPPDIILSHAPPYGCHDGPDVCHRGFKTFQNLIRSWRPSLFLHGHMHAYQWGERDSTIDGTRVVHVFPYAVLQVPVRNPVALSLTG